MQEGKKITEFQGEYRFLSNFWKDPFQLDGYVYQTNEHYYQSMKFRKNSDIRKEIRDAPSPAIAKKIARDKKQYIRSDWYEVNLEVMKKGLVAKFTQNKLLRQKLLATGNAILEEGNNWNDNFFGIDLKTGKGDNHLGKLLMEVRSELRQDED